jgi:hypothetical protein
MASPAIKKLILSDCSAALEASRSTPEAELPELFDYLQRVLELSTYPEIPYDPNKRAMGLSARDFLNAVRPNRDLDSKICAARFAAQFPGFALNLVPGLLKLEADPLTGEEAKAVVLHATRQTLISPTSAPRREEVASRIAAELTAKNSFTAASVLVELFPESLPSIRSLIFSKNDLLRSTAEKSLRLIDPSSKTFAELALERLAESDLTLKERIYSVLKAYHRPSAEGLMLGFRIGLDLQRFSLPLELVKASGEDTLRTFVSSEQGLSEVFRYFRLAPEREIRELSAAVCTQGRCDRIFQSLTEKNLTQPTEAKLLAALSTAECLNDDIWSFISSRWKESGRNHTLLLQALGAFPSRRNEAKTLFADYLNSPRKKGRTALGGDLTRAIARLMIRLAPLDSRNFQIQLGEEILGLESNPGEQNLPAEAISSLRPAPVNLLKRALLSPSEAVRRQGLLAIEKLRPSDYSLIKALLTEANEDTGESLAKNVLMNIGDRTLPLIEKFLEDKSLRLVTSEIVLRLRPGNLAAVRSAEQTVPMVGCPGKILLASLLPSLGPKVREQVLNCAPELITEPKALAKLGEISADEWIRITSALPQDKRLRGALLAEDLAAYMPEPLLAKELQNITDEPGLILRAVLTRQTPTLIPVLLEIVPKLSGANRLRAEALLLKLGELGEDRLNRFSEALRSGPVDEGVAGILTERELSVLNPILLSRWSEHFWPMLCQHRDERYLPSLERLISQATEETLPSLVVAISCINPQQAVAPLARLTLFESYTQLGKQKNNQKLIQALTSAADSSSSRFEKALHRQMAIRLQGGH